MKRIRKFLRLPPMDQWLLLKSVFLLGAITLGLKALSFQTLRSLAASEVRPPTGLHQASQPSTERIAWAVKVASRYVPAATCLPQALTGQMLFKRQGYPAQLHIGVTKGEKGQLEAHAWVESQGRIVIGGSQDLSRYTPLLCLERKSV